jgi:hypothetical protein
MDGNHLVGSSDAKWVIFTSYHASQVFVRGKALGNLFLPSVKTYWVNRLGNMPSNYTKKIPTDLKTLHRC